jgi:predicted dehydrogenase
MPGYREVLLGVDRAQPWWYDRVAVVGGLAIDGGSHTLRPLRMLMASNGRLEAVVSPPHAGRNPAAEMETLVCALCRFESGTVATFELCQAPGVVAWGPLVPQYHALGSEGELRVEASAGAHPEPDMLLSTAWHPLGRHFEHRGATEHHGHGCATSRGWRRAWPRRPRTRWTRCTSATPRSPVLQRGVGALRAALRGGPA